MTYNFDPERWYDMRLAHLESRLERKEIDQIQFEASLDDLDRRYEELVNRLDGSYQIPSSDPTDSSADSS